MTWHGFHHGVNPENRQKHANDEWRKNTIYFIRFNLKFLENLDGGN